MIIVKMTAKDECSGDFHLTSLPAPAVARSSDSWKITFAPSKLHETHLVEIRFVEVLMFIRKFMTSLTVAVFDSRTSNTFDMNFSNANSTGLPSSKGKRSAKSTSPIGFTSTSNKAWRASGLSMIFENSSANLGIFSVTIIARISSFSVVTTADLLHKELR